MSTPVVGRFAPTPSGRLHLGNLLCGLLDYLSGRMQSGEVRLSDDEVYSPR